MFPPNQWHLYHNVLYKCLIKQNNWDRINKCIKIIHKNQWHFLCTNFSTELLKFILDLITIVLSYFYLQPGNMSNYWKSSYHRMRIVLMQKATLHWSRMGEKFSLVYILRLHNSNCYDHILSYLICCSNCSNMNQ